MKYTYNTKGTCCTKIIINTNEDSIESVKFINGCDGNLKAIAKMVEGKNIEEMANLLKGITCRTGTTSCADQLSIALSDIINKQNTK
jgi:uncharacterized protein TIGR03905